MSGTRQAVVLGAGVTGLSAAWKLAAAGLQVTVLERSPHVGGLASTFRHGDFLLDLGPHKLTTLMDDIMGEIRELIGDELLCVRKQTRIHLNGKFLNYPVRAMDLLTGISPLTGLRCGFSYLAALTRRTFSHPADDSYQDWVENRFGRGVADLVFNCFARKLWGDPATLARELAETRIALPSLYEVFVQMILGIKRKGMVISTDEFHYPKFGTATLPERLAAKVRGCGGTISLGESVEKVVHDGRRFVAVETSLRRIELGADDAVVGTIPLNHIVGRCQPAAPDDVAAAVKQLRTRNLILIYVVLNIRRVSADNWIFFPEEKFIFNRSFEQKGFSPHMGPEDRTVLCLEITPDADSPTWRASDDELADICIRQLEGIGMIRRSDVLEHFAVRLGGVYQVYDRDFRKNSGIVFGHLDAFENFYSIGRHGGFNYVGQADCMDMGFRTAGYITGSSGTSRAELRSEFDNYAVLD